MYLYIVTRSWFSSRAINKLYIVFLFCRQTLSKMHPHFMHNFASRTFSLLLYAYPFRVIEDMLEVLNDSANIPTLVRHIHQLRYHFSYSSLMMIPWTNASWWIWCISMVLLCFKSSTQGLTFSAAYFVQKCKLKDNPGNIFHDFSYKVQWIYFTDSYWCIFGI